MDGCSIVANNACCKTENLAPDDESNEFNESLENLFSTDYMRIIVVALAVVVGFHAVHWNKGLAWAIAVVWVAALVYVAFVIRGPYAVPRVVFEPFHALRLFLKNMNTAPLRGLGFLEGAVLNLLMFIPVGYLVPVVWNKGNSLWKVLLFGLCLSLGVELLQLATFRGMFDLDDLMNNTIGATVGWACYRRWFL